MNTLAIIVAGGSGRRMRSAVPKQFLSLGGRPVLLRTVELFASRPATRVVVVLPSEHIERWGALCLAHGFRAPHEVCAGGATRWQSVRNGLARHRGEELVAIHDGVRPLVSQDTIDRALRAAEQFGAATPALEPVESVRILGHDGTSSSVDRRLVRLVQTPQCFRADIILRAYQQTEQATFTDDCAVCEAAGYSITLVEGNPENLKLTTPDDLARAELLLANV